MTKHLFGITGSTGNIGSVLTEELLKKGHKVRAIGRDEDKLQKLKKKGAEIFSFSLEDTPSLTDAFKGCDAIFSFIPPVMSTQDAIGESILQAILDAKIKHVLNLSSVGANLPEGTGPVKGLSRHEKRLNSVAGLNVLHLRPGYFMENLQILLSILKTTGEVKWLIKPDLPISMIATRDIALKAAEFLDQLTFTGQSIYDLTGPQEVTITQATSLLGKAIGKPDLKYKLISPAEAEKWMIANGFEKKLAKLFVEMYQTINEGKMTATQKLTSANKGQTTLEEFFKTFTQSNKK